MPHPPPSSAGPVAVLVGQPCRTALPAGLVGRLGCPAMSLWPVSQPCRPALSASPVGWPGRSAPPSPCRMALQSSPLSWPSLLAFSDGLLGWSRRLCCRPALLLAPSVGRTATLAHPTMLPLLGWPWRLAPPAGPVGVSSRPASQPSGLRKPCPYSYRLALSAGPVCQRCPIALPGTWSGTLSASFDSQPCRPPLTEGRAGRACRLALSLALSASPIGRACRLALSVGLVGWPGRPALLVGLVDRPRRLALRCGLRPAPRRLALTPSLAGWPGRLPLPATLAG